MKLDFSFHMFKNNLVCLFSCYTDINFLLLRQRNYKEWRKDTAFIKNSEDVIIRENRNGTTVNLLNWDKSIVSASESEV